MNIYRLIPSLLLLCFLSTQLSAQGKEDFKNRTACFIIKIHAYQSQKVADSLLRTHRELMEEYMSGKSSWPPPPPVRSTQAYDDNYVDHLIVAPKKMVFRQAPRFFTVKDDHNKYVHLRSLVSTSISRDSLTQRTDHLISRRYESGETVPIRYWEKEHYPIVSENRDVTKTINGLECHQIIMKDYLYGTGNLIEMFVTEEILLEYHPFLKVKEYLDRFYPLYIKSYDPSFPNESYTEYEYEMYEIAH